MTFGAMPSTTGKRLAGVLIGQDLLCSSEGYIQRKLTGWIPRDGVDVTFKCRCKAVVPLFLFFQSTESLYHECFPTTLPYFEIPPIYSLHTTGTIYVPILEIVSQNYPRQTESTGHR